MRESCTRREWLFKMATASAVSGGYVAGSSFSGIASPAVRAVEDGGESQNFEMPSPPAPSGPLDIDMYFGDWHNSPPRLTHGALEEHDILTRGDPLNATRKGAVLRFLNSYTYATLAPHASTTATRLHGQQEIFYISSGQGKATAGGQNADLSPNVAVLMPENLEFVIHNTADEPLTMYVINEPTPSGFRPNPNMLVRDENTLPIASCDNFWCHIAKTLYVTSDGLGTLESVLTVTLDPLTVGEPHVTNHNDIEEVWSALEGTSLAWLGIQLRRQPPGVAYLHPPATVKGPDNNFIGIAPHSNINHSQDLQSKFLYFARYHPHEPRP